MRNRLLATGITGTVITALCCVTPLLVFVFSAIGLSAMTVWLDLILLPLLLVFVCLTVYAFIIRKR